MGLALTGIFIAACCIGGAQQAAAQIRLAMFRPIAGHFGPMRGPTRPAVAQRGATFRGSGATVRGGRWRGSGEGTRNRGTIVYRGGKGGPHQRGTGGSDVTGSLGARGQGGNVSGGGGVPPPGERRFVPDEVLVEFQPRVSPQAIAEFARTFNLTQVESQSFRLIGGATFYRWRIGGGRSVPAVVATLQSQGIVASVQPNYIYALQEKIQDRAGMAGDAAQYVLQTLQIPQAHQLATGKNVAVAVIDSAIDATHPDLSGSIVKNFDALGGGGKPQQHGTAMAGAIAAHGKLLGIAPDAQILAERAFDDSAGKAVGTSFAIYKSLQWAADNAARVVNMSFVGPADPALHRMLAAAYEKGLVLIAAGGNGGAYAGPQYPAADPNVIAVTATDAKDGLFSLDNRNQYITIAAPGVEILALAPGDAYQITSGTSIAAAHVSGIAALMLQRQPSLKPSDVRAILASTTKRLDPSQHGGFGPGLVNAYRAIMALDAKSVGADALHEQAKQ
jgi:subtilisin family serine protease